MRVILALLAVVVVLGLGAVGLWLFLSPVQVEPIPVPEAVAALEDGAEGVAPLDVGSQTEAPSITRTVLPSTAPVEPIPVSAMPASYREALAGLRGRLVEEDGTPVAGVPVALLQIHLPTLFGSQSELFTAFGEERDIEVDSAVTDEDGTFLLDKAETRAFHGLGIDLGGPRATMRVVDVGLHEGETHDLGDVVLSPCVTFVGQVVDPAGEPVAGARVRATLLPAMVLQAGVTDIRADSALFIGEFMTEDGKPDVLELPSWVMAYESKLPIPTTHTEADGTFRLEGVPQGLVTVIADHPGFTGTFRSLPSGRSGERKCPSLMLSRGQTLTGHVRDAAGQPIPGVEVKGGVMMPIGVIGIAQPGTPTDRDGGFQVHGVAESGPVFVAARRLPTHPWKVVGPVENPASVVIEMAATGTLTLRLHDEAGAVVPEAELRVQPASMALQMPVMALRPTVDYGGHVRKVEDGVYEVRDLPFGAYRVTGRAAGHGIAVAESPLSAELSECELEFPPGRMLTVRVLDETTREPIEWARVALLNKERFQILPLVEARTDAQGLVTLGPAPVGPDTVRVWANHASYANHMVEVSDDAMQGTPEQPIELLLNGGGALEGRVHYAGRPVDPPHMILLEPGDSGHPDNSMPRLAVTDANGAFRFENLQAGQVRYEVYERFLFLDPQALIEKAVNQQFEPDSLVRGRVDIKVGENEFLDLNLDPAARGAPVSFVGIIHSDPDDEATYSININGENSKSVEVGANEHFRVENLPPGDYWVHVGRQAKQGGNSVSYSQVHQERVTLGPGEVKSLELELSFFVAEIQVMNRVTGTPVPDADVNIQTLNEGSWLSFGSRSDADGVARIEIAMAGHYRIEAKADQVGRSELEVDLPSPRPLVVELDPGVPCAGRIEFDEERLDQKAEQIQLSVLMSDGENRIRSVQDTTIPANQRTFEFFGLQPGQYYLWMWAGETRSNRWVEFELPERGDRNLVIRFNLQ